MKVYQLILTAADSQHVITQIPRNYVHKNREDARAKLGEIASMYLEKEGYINTRAEPDIMVFRVNAFTPYSITLEVIELQVI